MRHKLKINYNNVNGVNNVKVDVKSYKKEKKKGKTINVRNLLISLTLIFLLLTYNLIPIIMIPSLRSKYPDYSFNQRIIYMFVTSIIFLLFLIFIYKDSVFKNFKSFFSKNFSKYMKKAFSYWIIGILIMLASNFILFFINNGAIAGNEKSVRELIDKAPIFMLYQTVLYAPLSEELIFRRSFKDVFKNKYLYILISGLVFGGMHVISSASSFGDFLYIIPYGALGIAFAWLYYDTDNIFATISMHSLHNLLSIIAYWVFVK